MSVKVIDNTPSVKLEMTQRQSIFLRDFMEVAYKTAEPKTPKRRGDLRKNVRRQILTPISAKMIWGQVYAAAQEAGHTRGHPIRNYTTPGTGAHYALNAMIATYAETPAIARKARLA